jgi:predicted lipoprotein with Yx(FWY)xxD motif
MTMRAANVRVRGLLWPVTFTLVVLVASSGAASAAALHTAHKTHHAKFVIAAATQPGLGTILTTAGGLTLYTNVADTQNNSYVATQSYAPAWPPVLLPAGDVLHADRGIVGLGSYTLPNGKKQVTWQGLPLYRFIKDTSPHVVTGNGLRGFVVAFVQLQNKR